MSNWQPIETAPKGVEVFAYRADAGPFMAVYGTCELFSMSDDEIEEIGEDSFWQDDWWGFFADGVCRLEGDEIPTHWQLPEPPHSCPPVEGQER